MINASSDGFPALKKAEVNRLFLGTLSDVYGMKKHMVTYLPVLAQKASYTKLRMAIINLNVDFEKEIFILNLIFKLLSYDSTNRPPKLKGQLDIEQYIRENLSNLSPYETDYVILSHVIMLTHMEVGYYKIMFTLCRNLEHKQITDLVRECLTDARKSKKTACLLSQAFALD